MLSLIRNYEGNFEAQELIRLIAYTNQPVFLTGKAGTGKSYLLQRITETTNKKYVVLASTGVAALNVGGQTIHSFLRIEPRPYLPNDRGITTLGEEKVELLKKLDLIIIDEVSMVRCDLLQAVDLTLRKNLRSNKPFAGKQLLLIGDLFQLPPVVNSRNGEEVDIIEHNYSTKYFFSAHCFQNGYNIQVIELQKIYRQSDPKFIGVLNAVRNNTVQTYHLATINERYNPAYKPSKETFEITLTTTNDLADNTNTDHLSALLGAEKLYIATATGEFAKERDNDTKLPAPKFLKLKPQAQVMFIKNDTEKRWVNGSLGKIIALEGDRLKVRLDTNGGEHYILPATWEKVEFKWNKETEEIEKIVTGTYQQFPIKLAWAVTIHKSQGQTFENIIVDLGTGAFAPGQTYVALSRCKTLEGIKLRRTITLGDIKYDPSIAAYLNSKLNDAMIQDRYQSIIDSLQEHLATLEPENERLKQKTKNAEQVVKKAQTETQTVRQALTSKSAEVKSLQKEIGVLEKSLKLMKERQSKLSFWLFLFAVTIVILGYLLYRS